MLRTPRSPHHQVRRRSRMQEYVWVTLSGMVSPIYLTYIAVRRGEESGTRNSHCNHPGRHAEPDCPETVAMPSAPHFFLYPYRPEGR